MFKPYTENLAASKCHSFLTEKNFTSGPCSTSTILVFSSCGSGPHGKFLGAVQQHFEFVQCMHADVQHRAGATSLSAGTLAVSKSLTSASGPLEPYCKGWARPMYAGNPSQASNNTGNTRFNNGTSRYEFANPITWGIPGGCKPCPDSVFRYNAQPS